MSKNRWIFGSHRRRAPVPTRSAAALLSRRGFLRSTSGSVLLAFAGGAAALGSGVYAAPKVWTAISNLATNDDNPKAPTRIDVILIDSSDPPISPSQEMERQKLTTTFLTDSEINRKMMVVRLTDNPAAPLDVLFVGTDPGRPSEHGIVLKTPDEVRDSRQREYTDKINDAIRKAYIPPKRSVTPLIEGMAGLFHLQEFCGADPNVRKRVLVLTDTLQNTSITSYPTPRPKRKRGRRVQATKVPLLSSQAERYIGPLRTTVSATEITIGFLRRPVHAKVQTAAHADWWKTYLASNGTQVKWVELW
ncbi:MAG: hypothetical protein QOJ86_3188 [Bradyrhizobium sp.]|jgi:hypothetical protein|nr:hypothetical protein [Bradyrhizobium sp.]